MKLSYFNRIHLGKKVNINNIHFSSILNESLLDVRQKNASNLSDEEFKYLISFDPVLGNIQNLSNDVLASTPENYSRWLLKMNKIGELKNISPEKMQQYLKAFTQAKNRRNLLPSNDINSYKTIDELKNALSTAKDNLTVNQKNKDAKRNQKELQGEKKPGMYMDGAVELLFNGDNWEVWTPHTYEGSKALRRGASWCTGGDNCLYYDNYTADGTLYVIINKDNQKEKLQLFVPDEYQGRDREFRDANNDSVKFREFVHENPELLDFFLTQEDVTNSYKNLEDPSENDEWDEDRENDIAYEYDLTCTDVGEIALQISYSTLLRHNYLTDINDYKEMAMNGYLDYPSGYNVSKFYKKAIQDISFVEDVNWEDTQLKTLYKFYLKENSLSSDDIDFEKFLNTLFNTNDSKYNDKNLEKWFSSKDNKWEELIYKKISKSTFNQVIDEYVYDQLRKFGWTPPSRSKYTDYEYNFIYTLYDCHSVEQFYREYTNNGQKSLNEVYDDLNLYIDEEEGDISINNIDFSQYGTEWSKEDAGDILDIFMSIPEYNKFIEEDDDEENDEIEEVLRISGVIL